MISKRRMLHTGLALVLGLGLSLAVALAKPPGSHSKSSGASAKAAAKQDPVVTIVDPNKLEKTIEAQHGKVVVVNFYLTT